MRILRQRKEVILNLESRWKEYLTEKKLQEEQKKLLRTDPEDNGSSAKKGKEPEIRDLYLQEALAVLQDWLRIKAVPGK